MGCYLMILLVAAGVMTAHKSFVDPAALPHVQSEQDGTKFVNGMRCFSPPSKLMVKALEAYDSLLEDPLSVLTLVGPMVGLGAGGHAAGQDAEVQELESLKHPSGEGQSVKIMKSQSTTVVNENGKHKEQHDLREYIDENGKIIARVHEHSESSKTPGEKPHEHTTTELEVPSEGIHHTIVHDSTTEGQKEIAKAFPGAARLLQSSVDAIPQPPAPANNQEITENGNRRTYNADILQEENNNMDHYSSYSGVQYSPLDMAEYIFWTGDEKGVTLAIEEFLQEGMMTREEAIAFLQEIKYNIDYLQTHYAQQRLRNAAEERIQQDRQIQDAQIKSFDFNQQRISPLRKFNHENILKAITSGLYERNNNLPANLPQLPVNYPDFRQDIYKKSEDNYLHTYKMPVDQYEKDGASALSEEDYEELLEKLRVADFLYTEYSLEEVIYQLAKVMFTQSLARGSSEAQLALQKFTNFLEYEAEQGRISRALEKKVLDVLIESLSDTLTEHPELVTAARAGLGGNTSLPPGNKMLRQLLESGPADQANANSGIIAAYRDEVAKAQNKFNHQSGWMKSKVQPNGERQSAPLPMQAIKRFKMSV